MYGFFKKFFTLSECVSNVLITGEFNFDEKKCPTTQSFIRKELTFYQICILDHVTSSVPPCKYFKRNLPKILFIGLILIFFCVFGRSVLTQTAFKKSKNRFWCWHHVEWNWNCTSFLEVGDPKFT